MASNAERFREIINIFASYGIGELYHRRIDKQPPEERAKNLRLAFEELGPSFIKVGQILSTRNDILSPAYIKELKKLQSASPSFSFQEADHIFSQEMGRSMTQVFHHVDPNPLATGSIAQVHYGELADGRPIIIKVQRPGIKEEMTRDMDLFIRFIKRVPSNLFDFFINPVEVLTEIREQSLDELDFIQEAQSQLQFISNHRDRPLVQVPQPLLRYSSEKILVQEYVSGIQLSDTLSLTDHHYDLADIAEKLVISFLQQIFEDGFFHGDPHPGNILVREGKLTFIDFGIMGRLSPARMDLLYRSFEAIALKDIEALTQLIIIICQPTGKVHEVELYRDINRMYNRYLTTGFVAVNMNHIFKDLTQITSDHRLTIPSDFLLLIKTVIIIQGIAQDLDPDMNFIALFKTFISQRAQKIGVKFFQGDYWLSKGGRSLASSLNILPKTERLLDTFNNERLTLNLDFKRIDDLIRDVNQMINRLTIAIILAAIIISSGMIVTQSDSTGISWIGMFFFVAAVVLAGYLLFSFIRSRHR